ncbi:MAG: hypothetical protein WC360_03960 [Opitutales bacterium]
MTLLHRIWTAIANSTMDQPITPESLRQTYSEMSSSQLNTLKESELTPVAREALRAEIKARSMKKAQTA